MAFYIGFDDLLPSQVLILFDVKIIASVDV